MPIPPVSDYPPSLKEPNGNGSGTFLVCCLLCVAVVCVVAETILQATGHPPAPWIGTLAGTALGAALLWITPPRKD